jgi:RimJ/RimL family protein N-acetyltransferase
MTSPTPAFDRVTWPVRTARLSLRPATPADSEATWRYRRLPEVAHWITAAPETFEDYHAYFADPDRLAKTLMLEREGQVVGDLMLAVQDAWSQSEVRDRARGQEAELGWVLDPAHGGRGYATEAVGRLIEVCFRELGVRRVVANCFADNTGSWRLMERLGMRRELYTVRESLHRSGAWLDGMGYALLADEWQARQDAPAAAGQAQL